MNAVRETFVQLGRKGLEGNVLRKLGKGPPAGSQGDLCSWSEACGGSQLWPCRKWRRKTRKVVQTSHVNKEKAKRVRRALRL